jgi:hypothetical protein
MGSRLAPPPVESRIDDDRRGSRSSRAPPGTLDEAPDRLLSRYSRGSLGSRSRSGVRSRLLRLEGRLLRSERWWSRRPRSCSLRPSGPRLLLLLWLDSRLSPTAWIGSGPRGGARSVLMLWRDDMSGGRSCTGVVTGDAPVRIWTSDPARVGRDRVVRRPGPLALSAEALSSVF